MNSLGQSELVVVKTYFDISKGLKLVDGPTNPKINSQMYAFVIENSMPDINSQNAMLYKFFNIVPKELHGDQDTIFTYTCFLQTEDATHPRKCRQESIIILSKTFDLRYLGFMEINFGKIWRDSIKGEFFNVNDILYDIKLYENHREFSCTSYFRAIAASLLDSLVIIESIDVVKLTSFFNEMKEFFFPFDIFNRDINFVPYRSALSNYMPDKGIIGVTNSRSIRNYDIRICLDNKECIEYRNNSKYIVTNFLEKKSYPESTREYLINNMTQKT